MRTLLKILASVFLALLIASCNKEHYDLSNVHGINAEGEVLLPVAYKSFTVRDLMEDFGLLDEIEWSESGDMSLCFDYEKTGVVNGADMLKFKDVHYEESYAFVNPFQNVTLPYVDTIVSVERAIVFESENIHVMRAKMKSGRFDFTLESNLGDAYRVVFRSDNIKGEYGNDFVLDLPIHSNTFGFDLENLRYISDTPNTLNINFDLYLNVHGTHDSEISVDLGIMGSNLAFSEMQGFVDTYDNRNSLDSVFTLFPGNLGGALEVEGARIKVSERNTFGLGARLIVDTALVYGEGLPPYSILEPLPLCVDLPPQMEFREVLNREVNGIISSQGGRAYASTNFIVNPEGFSQMVNVVEDSRIDMRVSVEIPFSFTVDDITYFDTINTDFGNLELPEMIEQLTLELTFASGLPFNLKGSFFLYDSENDRITDTLLMNSTVIKASFDGRPVKTDVKFVIDEDRVEHAVHSDRIIMSYCLDSDARNMTLNAKQKLDLFLKSRVIYKADVQF